MDKEMDKEKAEKDGREKDGHVENGFSQRRSHGAVGP